ncbi:hypothetical protein GCM10023187_45720 [Nibrella viscosa]|uniref:Uncharacterized protein n=1 Tax=Nibrella viscosa TaxID=1084524 RepID=A0ABP8KTZ1_9BACT
MEKEKLDLDYELQKAQQELAESIKVLTAHGFVVDTTEWLTLKRYAKKYGVSIQVVTNWIGRGIIPKDCTMVLHEFNDIRLVKDRPYK